MLTILRWARNAAAVVGCWWVIVTCTPLVQWWAGQYARPWDDGKGDVLIVLAGDSLTDPVLGISSYWRAVYAVRALRANSYRKVILSGGRASDQTKRTASQLMRDFVASAGIDSSRLIVEAQSTSTEENAAEIGRLVRGESGKLVVLTSDYHVWRAYRVFRKQGMDVAMSPVPDVLKRYGTWHLRAGLFVELCLETAKIGWYEWKGWI